MKETIYRCDICENKRDIDDLIGISNTSLDMGINRVELVNMQQTVENSRKHICRSCIYVIYEYKKDEIEEQMGEEEQMKNTTFSCDLCKETKEVDDLMAYYINGGAIMFLEEEGNIIENMASVNNHICKSCIDKIVEYRMQKQ